MDLIYLSAGIIVIKNKTIPQIKAAFIEFVNTSITKKDLTSNSMHIEKIYITSFFIDDFIKKWNINDNENAISEGYAWLATFEIMSSDYFKIYFSSYLADTFVVTYYKEKGWSKIQPILIADVDNNNKNSLTLSGKLNIGNSGNFIIINSNNILRSINNDILYIHGGYGDNQGASCILKGKNYFENAGNFLLKANNGTNNYELAGTPDGTLTWAGNDLAGTAIVAKSIDGAGYVKYASGLIIQWSNKSRIEANVNVEVVFPISFTSTSQIYYTVVRGSNITTVYPIVKSIGGTREKDYFICSETANYVCWFAIGK